MEKKNEWRSWIFHRFKHTQNKLNMFQVSKQIAIAYRKLLNRYYQPKDLLAQCFVFRCKKTGRLTLMPDKQWNKCYSNYWMYEIYLSSFRPNRITLYACTLISSREKKAHGKLISIKMEYEFWSKCTPNLKCILYTHAICITMISLTSSIHPYAYNCHEKKSW